MKIVVDIVAKSTQMLLDRRFIPFQAVLGTAQFTVRTKYDTISFLSRLPRISSERFF